MSDSTPELKVVTDSVRIEVTDTRSAEAALPFVEAVFEDHLNDVEAEPKNGKRARHKPVNVECEHCGYGWEYRGENPKASVCPECNGWTKFYPPLDERGDR